MEQKKPNDTRFEDAGGQQSTGNNNRKSPNTPNDLEYKKRNPDNEPQAIDDEQEDIEDVEAIEEIDDTEDADDVTGETNTDSYGQFDEGNDDGALDEDTSNDHLG